MYNTTMYQTFKLPKLSFLGAGVLAEALAKGFIAAGVVQINRIWASAPTSKDTYNFTKLGCHTTTNNIHLVKQNNLIALTVKPQVLPTVLEEIAPHITPDHLCLSFAAGMNLSTIQQFLPPFAKVARLMTNTPVQFMEGVSSFSLGKNCGEQDRSTISKLMDTVGYCNEIKEELLDVVTGFAGGGPAYVYCLIEAIADGAVLGGIHREEALKMATGSVLGAAKMVEQTKKHPVILKDAVCSAGGTTIHGIRVLENVGFRGAIINAVNAASNRSKELGTILNSNIPKTETSNQQCADIKVLDDIEELQEPLKKISVGCY